MRRKGKRKPHWINRFWTRRWIKKHILEDLKPEFPNNRFVYVSQDGFYEDEYEGWTDFDWVYVYGPESQDLTDKITVLYEKYSKWEEEAITLVIDYAEKLSISPEDPDWLLVLDTDKE